MRHGKLAVLFVASMMVAAAAVSTADAGVGGCRLGWCGGKEANVRVDQGRTADILDALQVILPRPVVEGIKILGRGKDNRPAETPAGGPTPTVEGVGGCRFFCSGL